MNDAEIERIARVCHEATRAWYAVNGDTSQTPWMFTSDRDRHRVIAGVRLVLADPDASDSAQHDAWMAGKLQHGWRYGPNKNQEMLTHPHLLPFDKLTPVRQLKDRLFRAAVRALARV